MGKTTKLDHYWRSRDGGLLLKAYKGKWERKKRKEGGGQVHGSSCKKPEGIINRASFSPAPFSL